MLKFKAISPIALVVVLCLPTLANAGQESSYSYGHIRYIEGEVGLQRSSEPEPEVASINYPVLPGDRAWTLPESRAEFEYADGSLLRLDQQTRVDFVEFGDRDRETILRVWAGSIFLHLTEEQVGRFRIDTPSGTVYPASAGLFRIDVLESGNSTVLSVYEGVAELASVEGSVLVRSGQRSIAEPSRRPEPSFPFNTATYDGFASWNDARNSQYAYTERVEGIPPEVDAYVDDLSPHGTWRVDVQLGSVWYPSVSAGWYPYTHGRWSYTPYGQTWISYEPWGWAPYHYGRWGYSHYGWYWIPGAHWGPAWVSWAIGPSWVGWCPLGYHNRPAVYYDSVFYRGGKAVPRGGRGSLVTRTRGRGWNFEGREHFGRHSSGKARLRTADVRSSAGEARVLRSGAVLDRNLEPRVVGPAAMTRLPKNGLTGLRTGSSGSTQTGRTTATRRGETKRGPTETQTGALQTGRALSRTGSRTRGSDTENRSSVQMGSSRTSSSRGRVSPRETTGPREGERSSDSLRQGTARTGHRTPRAQPSDTSSARSTVRRIFQNPRGTESNSTNTTSRGRTTVSRPSSSEQQPSRTGDRTSRTNRSSTTQRPTSRDERPQGSTDQSERDRSQSNLNRGRTRSSQNPARSSSGRATSQSRSGSRDARGRDFYSRFPNSRPSANRPSGNRPSTNRPTTSGRPTTSRRPTTSGRPTPSRRPPTARAPSPRGSSPRATPPPSRPSGGSQSTGRARSTRGSAKKKKN